MGKFDGVLIASDFDNTMVFSEGGLRNRTPIPAVSPENRAAVEYFMAQGGTFSIATGRALPSFEKVRPGIPMNGPTILFNGAAIYDFCQKRYVHTAFLPEKVRGHVAELLQEMPDLAFEIYHDDNTIQAVNPNDLTRGHEHLTHAPTVTIQSIDEAPSPLLKLLFEEEGARQAQLLELLHSRPWAEEYEIVPSSSFLVELTVQGSNKGGALKKLAELTHTAPEHIYCVGDHANDIPMLQLSHIPFAPENAIDRVKALPGLRVLPHCNNNAIAEMIRQLDEMY